MSSGAKNKNSIGIIDIFSGPGGLGEGFSNFETKGGSHPFEIAVSAEMEVTAHATLRLRAFLRKLRDKEGAMPESYAKYLADVVSGKGIPPQEYFRKGKLASLWDAAEAEALNLTLGISKHNDLLYGRIEAAKKKYDALVLIGGPPCQAYSLVGRARQSNVPGFLTEGDAKHFLYKEYLQVIARYSPEVFIMENVKGILSSTVGGRSMFNQIRADLANPKRALGMSGPHKEYVLLPVHVDEGSVRNPDDIIDDPSRLIVRCEKHGIPQARHRVIIMGVQKSLLAKAIKAPGLDLPEKVKTIAEALSGLPKLRSGLSRTEDVPDEWVRAMESQRKRVVRSLGKSADSDLVELLEDVEFDSKLPRSSTRYDGKSRGVALKLRHPELNIVANHATRGHMLEDLGRYLFVSAYGAANKQSPSSGDFPKSLAPKHLNWESGVFADRFRVQTKKRPASTVTSHLSKDGHAFIHWDPRQSRSLSVREAARIQTFPDDYLFLGNRTQQFVQVGNAVPPLIAQQIANVVHSIIDN